LKEKGEVWGAGRHERVDESTGEIKPSQKRKKKTGEKSAKKSTGACKRVKGERVSPLEQHVGDSAEGGNSETDTRR